ncbi:MAG: thymidine phosphorylase [Burkholderiaceae bacterium]|nr:thymidine phosphorylase [Burkholderiaceae bacterium]
MLLPAEVIRHQRSGQALSTAEIQAFVRGLVDGSWSDAQVGAMAMAILWRGLDTAGTVTLTEAMTHSGEVLDWSAEGFAGPVLDKHSTGGVGDKVSLVLAPLLAACGAVVPMVSGRGLGHTGGTLDKLEALPGYTVDVPRARLATVLHAAGCAIVGASAAVAPADRRLYAIRDVTATVESLPLIVASILSKKRAAGLQALVMDVKCGNGAFCPTAAEALPLAQALVDVAGGAGLPTVALVTDMGAVLGRSAGNTLEVAEAMALLRGDNGNDPALNRLRDLCLALAAEALVLGGLAPDVGAAQALAAARLAEGHAAERFACMVAGLGGPTDVWRDAGLPVAPVRCPVPAARDGVIGRHDTRALGLAVVALGGGRRRPGDSVDPRVGLAEVRAPGEAVRAGEPLAWVHATDARSAEAAMAEVAAAMPVQDTAPPVPALVQAVLGR